MHHEVRNPLDHSPISACTAGGRSSAQCRDNERRGFVSPQPGSPMQLTTPQVCSAVSPAVVQTDELSETPAGAKLRSLVYLPNIVRPINPPLNFVTHTHTLINTPYL
ncbi:hypothetical protein DPEC_G00113600 [Dallia pectoralis]|uniref:Uncharacterized protein n=1 Tax=Dallia pectoralis TaxID=75939 RepID=A0ACC2GUB5_DALPE|nr:hypothetical protein DPEC_G00113600 [Dallia pectoralis]